MKAVTGCEKRSDVMNRMGLKNNVFITAGICTLNGIPYKIVNGQKVELKRVAK